MKTIFTISSTYKDVYNKIDAFSRNRIPFVLFGNHGSQKEIFIRESISDMGYDFTEISGEIFPRKNDILSLWEEGCSKKIILLTHLEKFHLETQVFINLDLAKKKEIKELPWVISTAGYELRDLITKRLFKEELYFKLGVSPMEIPPLFQRKKEILPIAEYLLETFTKKYKKRLKYFDTTLSEFLLKFNFPGDLDQLESLIESLVIMGKGRTLEFKNIPRTVFKDSKIHSDRLIPIVPGVSLKDYEREIIKENLKFNQGNREKTAKILDMSVRTLYRKLDEYDLKDFE